MGIVIVIKWSDVGGRSNYVNWWYWDDKAIIKVYIANQVVLQQNFW